MKHSEKLQIVYNAMINQHPALSDMEDDAKELFQHAFDHMYIFGDLSTATLEFIKILDTCHEAVSNWKDDPSDDIFKFETINTGGDVMVDVIYFRNGTHLYITEHVVAIAETRKEEDLFKPENDWNVIDISYIGSPKIKKAIVDMSYIYNRQTPNEGADLFELTNGIVIIISDCDIKIYENYKLWEDGCIFDSFDRPCGSISRNDLPDKIWWGLITKNISGVNFISEQLNDSMIEHICDNIKRRITSGEMITAEFQQDEITEKVNARVNNLPPLKELNKLDIDLMNFKEAYEGIRKFWLENCGNDYSDTLLDTDYPFKASFDDLAIVNWAVESRSRVQSEINDKF